MSETPKPVGGATPEALPAPVVQTPTGEGMQTARWRRGACHCRAVQFEAFAPDRVEVEACNCSICRKTGFLHLIVPKGRFQLHQGRDSLTAYRFNTGVAEHTFCKVCGVKPFYTPRSNPDGVSVNARCFDDGDAPELDVVAFDGRNWEANAAALAHKSDPG